MPLDLQLTRARARARARDRDRARARDRARNEIKSTRSRARVKRKSLRENFGAPRIKAMSLRASMTTSTVVIACLTSPSIFGQAAASHELK